MIELVVLAGVAAAVWYFWPAITAWLAAVKAKL